MKTSNSKEISIGFNSNLDNKKRDGVAWVKNVENGLTGISFTTDKPELLIIGEENIIKSIFDQILKIGYLPHYVELFINGIRKLYMFNVYSAPIYIDNI